MLNRNGADAKDKIDISPIKNLTGEQVTTGLSKSQDKVKYQNIPKELIKLPQWLHWRYGKLRANGKKSKIPCDFGGVNFRGEIESWKTKTLKHIYNEKQHHLVSANLEGVGFVPAKDDPYFVIDIDGCFDEDKNLKQEYEWLLGFDTYTEVSPSGIGLRVIGKLEDKRKYPNAFTDEEPAFGIYTSNKWFTITGNIYQDHSQIKDCTSHFESFIEVVYKFKHCLNSKKSISSNSSSNKYSSSSSGVERNLRTFDAIFIEYFESIRPRAVQRRDETNKWNYAPIGSESIGRAFFDTRTKRPFDNKGELDQRGLLVNEFGGDSEIVKAFDMLVNKTEGSTEDKTENDKLDKPIRNLVPFSQHKVTQYDYIVDCYIPEVGIVIVAGPGDVGKSYMLLSIACSVINGSGFPIKNDNPGKVLWYTQDDPDMNMEERMDSLGLDKSKIFIDFDPVCFSTKQGLLTLKHDIEKYSPRIIIADTLTHYASPNRSLKDKEDVTEFYRPLNYLSQEYKVPFIFTNHFVKGNEATPIRHRIAGSPAVVDLSFSTLVVQMHPDGDETHRIITHEKHNYTAKGNPIDFWIDKKTGFKWGSSLDNTVALSSEDQVIVEFMQNLVKEKDMLSSQHIDICKKVLLLNTNQMRHYRKLAHISIPNKTLYVNKYGEYCVRHPDRTKRIEEERVKRAKEALESNIAHIKSKKFNWSVS
jgi:archaellum biogenesis ATPase FlaH